MPNRIRVFSVVWIAAMIVAITPVPALAAPLGSVLLPVTSGTVDATPVFASGIASAPCPAGFGRNAQLRVGPPGGPYSNLARPLSAGGYDRAPVAARPNRSLVTALGGAPVDGEWWVVVECVSQTQGVHPDRFVTPITVSGRQWRVGRPAGGAPASPGADGSLVVPAPGGSGTTGPPGVPVGAGPASSGATSAGDPAAGVDAERRLTGNGGTGSASVANLWWILASLGVLAVVATTWLTTRRRETGPVGRRGPRR